MLTAIFLCVQATAPSYAAAPENTAESAILVDAGSGRVLYEKNAGERRLIASLTKLMTALVAVESTPHLDDIFTIKPEWTGAEGTSIYLTSGEQLSLKALLYGLLLESGNDAAMAVAGCCAGDVKTFVGWMNQRAQSLNMMDTHFANPSGLNAENHYSTASDLAKLSMECMRNDVLSKIMSTKSITIDGRTMINHNKQLWRYDGCVGMKTGYTQTAGRTLITCAERDGQRLIAVTLSDRNDWDDHAALMDYGFQEYPRFVMCREGANFRRIPVSGSLVRFVPVAVLEEVSYPLSLTEQVTADISLPELVEAPVRRGAIAGSITFRLGEKLVGETYLVYSASVQKDVVASHHVIQKVLDFFRNRRQTTFIEIFKPS